MADDFYKSGLRFSCTRCSSCCRYQPGYVFLTEADMKQLQRATGLSRGELATAYCRQVSVSGISRLSLKEKANFDCIFWERDGCRVYRHRPLQCRSFPFWASNLASEAAWEDLKDTCPGVGCGKTRSRRTIVRWLGKQEKTSYLEKP
jgi:Fe-S-cluster containining protein